MPLMDRFDSISSPLRPRPIFFLAVIAVATIAIGYLFFIRSYTSPYAAGSDASGYLNIARLLSEGQLTQPAGPIEGVSAPIWDFYFQQPLGFVVNRDTGIMVPTYPIGLPIHLWLASKFVGLKYAAMLVNVCLAAAAGGLMVALGRQFGLAWSSALAGAAILWACPLYVFMGLQPMSDVPAMIWCMAALSAALSARTRPTWSWATGAAFAIAVLVRPSNLLLLAPAAFVFGRQWRLWFGFVLGGLPGALFLAWYNYQLYGSVLSTGYGDVRSAFSLEYVPHNVAHVTIWLMQLLSPVFGIALLGIPWAARQANAPIRLLLIWSGVFIGFYLFYYHTGETWWYLRFLLPAFPALVLLSLFGAKALVQRAPLRRNAAVIAAIALACVLLFQLRLNRELHVVDVKHNDTVYVQLTSWLQDEAPRNAIVMAMQASGALLFYTKFTVVRWDLPPPNAQAACYAAAEAAGRPIYAALFDFEEKEAFAGRLTGVWQLRVRFGRTGIWQRVPASQPST